MPCTGRPSEKSIAAEVIRSTGKSTSVPLHVAANAFLIIFIFKDWCCSALIKKALLFWWVKVKAEFIQGNLLDTGSLTGYLCYSFSRSGNIPEKRLERT